MYVLVYHRITDRAAFWRLRERPIRSRPVQLRLVHALPSRDRRLLCCLWEGDSLDTVRSYADAVFGRFSQNECYEVDEAEALGLQVVQ